MRAETYNSLCTAADMQVTLCAAQAEVRAASTATPSLKHLKKPSIELASHAGSIESLPAKKLRRQAEAPEPSAAVGNLALEDDFFLDADTTQAPTAPEVRLLMVRHSFPHVCK